MTTTKKAQTKKVTVPAHKQEVDKAFRKNIVKRVQGKATSVRDEAGKKVNRQHVITYQEGDNVVTATLQIIYGKELLAHTKKDIVELTNRKGSVYYFIPLA